MHISTSLHHDLLANDWRIDAQGWLNVSAKIASPNFDVRPSDMVVDMIVIHNISLPPKQYGGNHIIDLFTNQLNPNAHPYFETIAHLRVSSHFLIKRDGALMQCVSCLDRAWHAGVSQWQGRERCNDFSVGIELEGCDDEAFADEQYAVLRKLITTLKQSYAIKHVVGHSDIAPGRKTDPGPFFDWQRIHHEA